MVGDGQSGFVAHMRNGGRCSAVCIVCVRFSSNALCIMRVFVLTKRKASTKMYIK